MGIVIRRAMPDDAYELTVCHVDCFRSAYQGIVPDAYLENMPLEMEKREARYRTSLAEPGECEYYCVMHAGRMIGFLTLHRGGEIWAVYLLEAFRGKGYGREMLDFAVCRLRRMGLAEISLWVFEDNTRARRFYERHGFGFDGAKREMTYGKPLVQLRYVLDRCEPETAEKKDGSS